MIDLGGIQPVPVTAYGRRFRSTTEVRWATFLTAAGIAWEYEPETYDLGDLGWYLPDFWLPREQWFLEVKPGFSKLLDKDYDKAKALHIVTKKPVVLVSGYGMLPTGSWIEDDMPGWAYDVFTPSGISHAGAGGGSHRLVVCTCGSLQLALSGDSAMWVRDHPACNTSRASEKTRRAYEAGASFRAGRTA